MYVEKLVCSRCGETHHPEEKVFFCSRMDGRLDIYYDYDSIADVLTKDLIERRKNGIWRYRELLPTNKELYLGEGGTPLIKARNLSEELHVDIYLKDETRNPTWSFKDRPISVGVAKGVEFNVKVAVTASSGNAAASLAAFSAKAGIKAVAFVPHFSSLGKVAQLIMYGAEVVRLRWAGSEDPTVKMMREMALKYGWYPVPSFGPFNPYQFEGNKTISYEIAEQLSWSSPDWVIIPVGGGGLLAGSWKGFKEFKHLDLIRSTPRIAAIQPEGNSPLVRAFKQGKKPFEIEPWGEPHTIATGLEDPYPWDGDAALTAIRESEGTAISVSDEEILESQKLLARKEGIFAEPSGVASLAGMIKLVKEGVIERGDKTVVLITGGGLKDMDVVLERVEIPPVIEPDVNTVLRYLGST